MKLNPVQAPDNRPPKVVLRPASIESVAMLEADGLPPLAARVFAARGLSNIEEIAPPLRGLPPPDGLPGIEEMAMALAKVCASDEPICVVGDYDVDGTTAATLAYDCLQKLGASVSWHIPCRYTNGYGLTPEIAEQQASQGVRHLLMVDNGTTAHEGIHRAKKLGMRVYVTDHHQPDDTPNKAHYLVNPHVDGGKEGAGYENLVGVGLAFYLMAQLRREMEVDLDMAAYLDLVALGTVADCGTMDITNRALVSAGLARLRSGRTRPGIAALMRQCRIGMGKINSRMIGFRLAPRINAAGRVESADVAMHCLLAKDDKIADIHAERLTGLNQKRIFQQDETMKAVLQMVDERCAGIALGDADWSPGIIGIIAGKVAEKFNRPCFIFHLEDGERWRGSGRTACGVDLFAILEEISAKHPRLVIKYGGHRQAASVAIKKSFLPKFAKLFNAACKEKRMTAEPPVVEVDALSAVDITAESLVQLETAVWGVNFPSPLYMGRFEVMGAEPLRGGHLQLRLRGAEDGAEHWAVLFGKSELAETEITALFSAGISPYNGKPQFVIERLLSPSEVDAD